MIYMTKIRAEFLNLQIFNIVFSNFNTISTINNLA